MSLNGTVNKTGLCWLPCSPRRWPLPGTRPTARLRMARCCPGWRSARIGGFIVALITIFKKEWSPVTAPAYALLEGLFLGAHLGA